MELVERILQHLRDQYCVEYTGKLTYRTRPEAEEYVLEWPLNPVDERPLMLMGQFNSEEDFFNYIKKEIKTKRFFLYKNFIAYKLPQGEQLPNGKL